MILLPLQQAMFLSASLLTPLLALLITGSPVEVRNSPIILPHTRRLDLSNGTIDLVQHEKARVSVFRDYHTHGRRAESITMRLADLSKYIVALNVGSPPTTYNLVVDSGSAVTWIGNRTPYDETGDNTGQVVQEDYGGGWVPTTSFTGIIFIDTVTLGGELTIPNYELTVSSGMRDFIYDGILGIGPRDLTANTLRGKPDTYPTFTGRLVDAGVIGHNLIGIFFQPITGDPDTDVGELTFGEIDYTKCTDDIVYTPITDDPSASAYWGIKQSITYGETEILDDSSGIIDTGSDYIGLASYAYGRYKAATGATFDQPTGLLRITTDQYNDLRELKFHINNHIFGLIPNAQIWPRSLNQRLDGGEEDGIYLIIDRLDTDTGVEFDFILGYSFMQRFYTVLDGDDRRVGFAPTSFTPATTN
ncbi:aspartic peptidase domain-containing protein [Suillus spraguei]|nr:aspartic peptidase domain-containing protein [Suillus spraguei]